MSTPSTNPGQGRGPFITLEGPDGSGKSSLLPRLAARLRARGVHLVTTREPGSTPLGERIRAMVLDTEPKIDRTGRADALLFAAARTQHVDEVIRPALARGAAVLCDRYADSSMAYQGAGSQIPADEIRALQEFATGGLWPDLTIVLDLPVEVGLARKSDEITRFEAFQDLAYHERVRAAFLALAASEPQRYTVVDATADPDAVLAAAARAVDRLAERWPMLLGDERSASSAEPGASPGASPGAES